MGSTTSARGAMLVSFIVGARVLSCSSMFSNALTAELVRLAMVGLESEAKTGMFPRGRRWAGVGRNS